MTIDDTGICSSGERASVTRVVRLTDTPLGGSESFLFQLWVFSPTLVLTLPLKRTHFLHPMWLLLLLFIKYAQPSVFQTQDRIVLLVPCDWGLSPCDQFWLERGSSLHFLPSECLNSLSGRQAATFPLAAAPRSWIPA